MIISKLNRVALIGAKLQSKKLQSKRRANATKQVQTKMLHKLPIFCSLFLLLFPGFAYGQSYCKEAAVEVMASGGFQQGGIYQIIGAIAQPALVADACLDCSGYVPNLNSRIITKYVFDIDDTSEDNDSKENTQVAGVYFPLSVQAKNAFGNVTKKDSGTKLYLVTNKDWLKADTDHDSSFDDTYLNLTEGAKGLTSSGVFSNEFRAYGSKAPTSLWLKLVDARNLASNIFLININPAWISSYSITNSSPQKQGEFWKEAISCFDAYGNTVSDTSHLTTPTHIARQVDLGLTSDYTDRPSDDPLKFYSSLTASGQNPLGFDFSTGDQVYLKDSQAETIELSLTGDVYSYGIGSSPSLVYNKTFTSGPIQVLGWKYKVMANFEYDRDDEALYVSTWLEKGGNIISPGAANVVVYDSSGSSLKTLSKSSPDSAGIFHLQWPAELSATDYLAKAELTYQGKQYRRDFSFMLEPDEVLTERIEQTLKVKLDDQEEIIEDEPEETKEEIVAATETIQADLGRVLVAAEAEGTISNRLDTLAAEELKPKIQARILNTATHILQGGDLVVNFQTYPSVSPVLDIYDSDGKKFISNQSMEELEKEGLYQAKVTFGRDARRGSYTLVCSESTYGTMDALSLEVGLTNLERISRDTSSTLGSLVTIQNLKQANDELRETFDSLSAEMSELITRLIFVTKEKVSSYLRTEVFRQRRQSLQAIYDGLEEIKNELSATGVFPQGLIDDVFALDRKKGVDIAYLQNKMKAAEVFLKMMRGVLDKRLNAPVQEYWYEFR